MKKLKDITVKQNPAPAARPLGVNPSDPWSAKAGITEGALEQYLMSRGVNPNFISTQMKISHAKSTAFLKWKQNHVESVEYVDEAGRCWSGYKPVPGKKAFSPGSCAKEEKGSQTTELTPEEVEVDEMSSMSMAGLRHATTFNKGATAHHALAGHVTVGRTDKHTGMTHVTGVKDNKTYQVRMHTLRAHPIGEDADPVKQVKTTALDKFRAASTERTKKHNDIQKNQSKDGSGMSSAIDRLAKRMGEEVEELVEETLKNTNYKGISVDSKKFKPSKSLRAQNPEYGKDYHIFKGVIKKPRGNDKNFVVHNNGHMDIEFKYPDHTADEKEAIMHHLRSNKKLKEEASQDAENKFHAKLDKLVHKTFGKRKSEMKMKEEVEQIDEISKSTLTSYKDKSSASLKNAQTNRDAAEHGKQMSKGFADLHAKSDATVKKRVKGLIGYMQRKQGMKPTSEDVGDAKAAVNADGLPNASLEPVSEKKKQMTKSARMIKALYKKKGMVKEDMFDSEKEDKSVATYGKKPKMSTTSKMSNLGDNKPEAASVLSGGTTLTGQKRDMLEIDPAMRNRPGQPDITKDTKKVR